MMPAEAILLEQIILNRIALLEARTGDLCALLEPDPAEWDRLKREHFAWRAAFTNEFPEWRGPA